MVCDYPHCHFRLLGLMISVSGEFFYPVNHSGEDVGVIVACLSLEGHAQPLESHSRVDILVRKRLKMPVCLAVELHEDKVPDFYHKVVALVDKLASRYLFPLLVAPEVDMDFAAWAAWTGVAHFPEIVMPVAEENPVLREIFLPFHEGFGIHFSVVCRIPFEYCRIEPVLVNPVNLCQKFPGPCYGFFLEIVPEAPVAEHFKHGVVVRIMPHFFEVIMFPADSQTFLTVSNSLVFRCAVAEKPVLELVHAGIGEHQCRIVFHDHGCRRDNCVPLGCEKVQESLSYFF